jgi:Xaa-Pro aminopeptidase
MFSATVYRERRQMLRRRLSEQKGLLVFLGNELCPMNYTDNTFPFRQDSTFLYYFGLDAPSLTAAIDLDDGTERLYGNDPALDEIVWTGPQMSLAERGALCGVTLTDSSEGFGKAIQNARMQGRKVHLLPQYQAQNIVRLSEMMQLSCAMVHQHVSEPFTRAVIAMRSVKSDEEIGQIEQAIETARLMHLAAMNTTAPGLSESQVVAEMERVVIGRNCRMAFPVIFTIHGEILHNHFSSNTLKAGDIIINDSGVENAMHYASDITRTLPVGGQFSSRQKDIYELVLSALNQSIAKVSPGVEFRTVHLGACRILAEGLKMLGLMKGNVDDAVECGAHALFFQCGLGHMLGLDVHDMEGLNEQWVGYTDTLKRSVQFGLRSLRLAKAVEPGYVVTVEPGLYFIPALIEQWESQRKFTDFINYDKVREYQDFGGVRIEDDVLVTPQGVRVLSEQIPKTCREIESLVGST